jgi:antitoxin component YwqK of YwqJK toxin-antitoxin module
MKSWEETTKRLGKKGSHGELIKGIKRNYFSSGKIRLSTVFKNGMKNGLQKEYLSSGRILCVTSFKDDKENGKIICFYGFAILESIIVNIEEGIAHDLERCFFKNGMLRYVTQWENGEINGNMLTYLENGHPDEIFIYKHNSILYSKAAAL